MHSWGDEGVDWKGIDEAGWFIGGWLRRWVRMGVTQIKEKYGTVRVYCGFGWSTFYEIWRPGYAWAPTWYPWRLDMEISRFIMPILNRIVIPIQKSAYRWRYKKAIQKWPHLKEEILDCADWNEELEGL